MSGTGLRRRLAMVVAAVLLAGFSITAADAAAQATGSGSISGHVNGHGAPLSSAQVFAYLGGSQVANTLTDSSGNYTISGLPAGTYTLYFTKGSQWTQQWWDHQDTEAAAQTFDVSGAVTGKNADLLFASTISGTVTSSVNSAALADVYVAAYDSNGVIESANFTDASGHYTLGGLAAGSYRLRFSDSGGSSPTFSPEWYGNVTSYTSGTIIFLDFETDLTGKNASMTPGATISGEIHDLSTLAGIPGAVAVAYLPGFGPTSAGDVVVAAQASGPSGAYSLTGIPQGDIKVAFLTQNGDLQPDPLASSYPYVSEFYNEQYSYATATAIPITTLGQHTTAVDAYLQKPLFEDVADPTSPFYPAIQFMGQQGFSTGTPNPPLKPLYKPLDPVSRQAMASFLFKFSHQTFSPPNTPSFADVDQSNPFYGPIEWMAAQGISTGTAQGGGQKPLYKPADPVSRQSMAIFLARYEGASLAAPATQDFADVPITAASAGAIHWMLTHGVSTGTPNPPGLPLYKPLDPVSRQAMALFLYRIAHF